MVSNQNVRAFCILLATGAGAAALPALGQDAGTAIDMRPAIAAETAPATPAAPVLSPEAAAFRDALGPETARLDGPARTAVERFDAGRDFAPFWTVPGSDRLDALLAALDESGAHGLPSGRYADAVARLGAADLSPAAREAVATGAFLRLAADLSGGVLAPSKIVPEIDVTPTRPAPAALLARLDAEPTGDLLRSLEPSSPDYRRLIAEKARLEQLIRAQSWGPPVPDGPTLHAGDISPRVAELRARLARLGYGVPAAGEADGRFDEPLFVAVQGFQRDHGLLDDGVVGRHTLDAINAPAETRLAQVLVNLERMRWLNRDPGARHLLVNIPDFSVTLYEDGAATWRSKVVVGKTHVTETPEFSGTVRTMVVNPTWHIPDSIAIRDYLPKLQRDPMVLKRQNIRLLTRGGTEINPKLVDFTQYTPANFPFRIKQRPSDDNALGQVKFLFPNEHSVYMHDTPHRELFAKDERAFSNGCVRLEKPVELAHIVLAGQVPDPAAAFDGWRAAKKERSVTLERSIPVVITYRSVWFDEGGAARYRADVYGRDAKVFEALEAVGVTLPAAQG